LTTARFVFLERAAASASTKERHTISNMNLPDFVPELELIEATLDGGEWRCFCGDRASLVPREEATRSLVRSLNSLVMVNTKALQALSFDHVHFEMASISAIQDNLHRLFDEGCNYIHLGRGCDGEVEKALCVLFESKCRWIFIDQQCLAFTPDLAVALRKSTSLESLTFDRVTFDKAGMELLALGLCDNSSITTLTLNGTFQGDESIVIFAKYLPSMSHLRYLRLEGNEFGEAGERALVEVLEQGDHSLNALFLEEKSILQKYVNFLLWVKRNRGKPARLKWIELLTRASDCDDEDPPSALYFTLCSDPGRFENI
jgi:hypothetical protein